MTRSFSTVKLTEEEFDDFSASHPQGNFQQTAASARLRHTRGEQVELLGVQEDGRLVGAALVEIHPSHAATFCAVHDGPLCDLQDRELTEFFMGNLREYAKSHGAIHLDITPELHYRLRDSEGNELPDSEGGSPNDEALQNLIDDGFTHGGFTRGYTAVPRWRYLKDLTGITTEKELMNSYSKRTQWSVKRAKSMGVVIREAENTDDLETFSKIEQKTAERRHFEYRGTEYFSQLKDAYGDDAHFVIAYIDTKAYLKSMQDKASELQKLVDGLQAKLDQRETTKLRRRFNEEHNNLQAARKRLKSAEELVQRGDMLPAACSLFICHPHEVVYLFSGSEEEFKPFYAPALIQHYAMLNLCVNSNGTRYNFYGIDGIFDDPESEGRGVLEFKQGFNGYVEELMGEFVMPIHPAIYKMEQMAHKLLKR